jgi:hypothetical protein
MNWLRRVERVFNWWTIFDIVFVAVALLVATIFSGLFKRG